MLNGKCQYPASFFSRCTQALRSARAALENPYTGFDTIKEIESDTPLLVGCFEKEEGTGHAFTVVNYSPFKSPKTSHVRVKLDGKVTQYINGDPCVMHGDSGYYKFVLPQGQGVFVTVE